MQPQLNFSLFSTSICWNSLQFSSEPWPAGCRLAWLKRLQLWFTAHKESLVRTRITSSPTLLAHAITTWKEGGTLATDSTTRHQRKCANCNPLYSAVYEYLWRWNTAPGIICSAVLVMQENGCTHLNHTRFWWVNIIIIIFIIIINLLTTRVIGAPQMISQPVSSIFLCSPLPSGTWWTPGLSISWCCLPTSTSSSVCLVFFPLSLCLARWFWPDLMNGRHVHTTAVCIFLWWSGGLRVVRLPDGSWHRLLHW